MPRRRRAWLAVTLTLALATAGVASGLPASARSPAPGVEHVATGTGGAVVSDSPEATQAGLSVLRHGGNAADAAVAVASTLGVTDPYVAGIGGGGYFVYYDARTHQGPTIRGRQTTPAGGGPAVFLGPRGQPPPLPPPL